METTIEPPVTLNAEQGLYLIKTNHGYSCLGFDVCLNRLVRLSAEMQMPIPENAKHGTIEAYDAYKAAVEAARAKHSASGGKWRSSSELTPELVGFEGKRVEVKHQWSDDDEVQTARFIVGKSTGFIPCHLKLANITGGGVVCLGKIISVRTIKTYK